MVGVGETDAEVSRAMRQLRDVRVDMITLGQYIAPGRGQLPVARYVPPGQFKAWRREAMRLGFKAVASGPLVRSSYRAGLLLREAQRATRLGHEPENSDVDRRQ